MIKNKYRYFPKQWMMTKNEYHFYQVLSSFLDDRYVVIPQVHLDELVKIPGGLTSKMRIFFLRYIIQNSVDFVICNKLEMHPLLAIELDDKSHTRKNRRDRDEKVENILDQAKVTLLRVPSKKFFDKEEIKKLVLEKLV